MVKRRKSSIYQGRSSDNNNNNNNTTYTPTPGSLLQRGNYSLLRLLFILNAAGADGLTTVMLLEQMGSKADRMNAIIRKAQELKLIERVRGESKHGQFPRIYNVITDKGRQLLQKQQV
ncbi:MAG TPA: hypothetical protein VKA87_04050 [Nitrososphaeraceae archaeon]|nr:hypothetical protein [Nitrososphaeraceae archaeon]